MFEHEYARAFDGDKNWQSLDVKATELYAWDEKSTYVKNPPYFDDMTLDNGPTRVVPGSHRHGRLDALETVRPHSDALARAILDRLGLHGPGLHVHHVQHAIVVETELDREKLEKLFAREHRVGQAQDFHVVVRMLERLQAARTPSQIILATTTAPSAGVWGRKTSTWPPGACAARSMSHPSRRSAARSKSINATARPSRNTKLSRFGSLCSIPPVSCGVAGGRGQDRLHRRGAPAVEQLDVEAERLQFAD